MNYSRRQLYAMGEPFGDSATRMEVGGKIIYGGGGGSPPPQPTTTITESGPSVSSFNRTTVNEIPDYLTGASQDLVSRGQALTARPYEGYTGDRVSEFTPQMQQAFDRMGGQQVAGQIGQATGIAGLASQQALQAGQYQPGSFGAQQVQSPQLSQFQLSDPQQVGAQSVNAQGIQAAQTGYSPDLQQFQMGPAERVGAQSANAQGIQAAQTGYRPDLQQFQMGPAERVGTQSFTDPNAASQYMNPYMQNVVDVQQREAQRQADIAGTQRGAQAVRSGAFGGSRQAIMDAEAQRNLSQQMGDIQATGSQAAFQQAQSQFNQEQQARLQAQQANQQAGLTTGIQNLAASLGIQQLGTQTGLQTSLANLSNQQQTNVQNAANQLQAQGMNQDAALRAALANQQAGLTTGQQNLASQLSTQQLGTQTGVQTALANLSNQQQASVQNAANQLQAQGMNQDAALRAALANQQAGLSTGQQNLSSLLSTQQLGAQTGLQAQMANQQAGLEAQRASEQSRQFGSNLGLQGAQTALQGASQLGQLGQQQFGQEMGITQGLGTAGDIQRQREQALLDAGYQDYLAEQKYPYEQLAFQQGLVAGVPYSTTQQVTGREVTQPGKQVQQRVTANPSEMAAGGEVKSYAAGGIASLNQPQMASAASGMSDQQLQQTQGLPSITQLAQMTLQAEEQQRAQMRAAQQAQMAQRPQGTVADEEMARIAAMEQGIGGLDVPDDLVGDEYTAAGGGIVAFSNGGKASWEEDLEALQAPPQESSSIGRAITGFFTRSDDVEALRKRAMVKQAQGLPLNAMEAKVLQSQAPAAPAQPTGIASLTDGSDNRFARGPAPDMSGTRGRQGIAQLITPPADTGGGPARSSTSFLDKMFGDQEKFLREANTKEADARRAYMEDMEKDKTESSEFAAKARQKIEQRMAGLEGEDRAALESSVLDFGLRLLSAKGEKNMAKALAEAGLNTIAGHKQALKEIAAKRDKYDDALAKVDEFEYGERKGTAKERRAAMLSLGQIDADLSKSMANLAGERGTIAFQMWKEGKADARAQSSRSPDYLALLTKYPAGTPEGDKLREDLEFIKGAGKADPVLQSPVFKEKAKLLGMLEMRYSMAQDPKVRSQLESDINNLKIEMASMQRGGGGGGRGSSTGGGSGTVDTNNPLLGP